MPIIYPREWKRRQDTAFAAIAAAAGPGGRALPFLPLSPRGFPETPARLADCLARAKRQPQSAWGRWLKARLIAGQYNWARRYFTRHPTAIALCWNGLTGSRRAFMLGARDAGARRLFAELAPLPGRMTLDPAGVNAESSVPRARAFYEAWAGDDPARRGPAWRALGADLVARPSRRADVGQAAVGQAVGGGADLAQADPFLFVPLQVPDDSQMRLFAGWAGGIEGFIAALGQAAAALPPGWSLRLKEHPSSRIALGGAIAAAQAQAARAGGAGQIILDNHSDSFAQLAASRGVVTINSSMGLQAFFHDKPVIATGTAFWAQPGLALPVGDGAALQAAFAGAESLGFDPDFRAIFMNWLDQVYYPRVTATPEGGWQIDPQDLARILDPMLTPTPDRPLAR